MRSLDESATTFEDAQPESAPHEKSEPSPEQLEMDIDGIRENLGELITELDHRRHRLNPMYILRNNPLAVAAGGALLVGLCVGGIAWRVSRSRKTAAQARDAVSGLSSATRAQLQRLVLGGVVDASSPSRKTSSSVTMKILAAAGTAVAGVAARRLAEGAFARARTGKSRQNP